MDTRKRLACLAAPALAVLVAVIAACADGLPDAASPSSDDAPYDTGYSEGFAEAAASFDAALPPSFDDGGVLIADARRDVHVVHEGGFSWDAPMDAPHCTTPLAPGDLAIVELMIASQPGTGDHGEWLEVLNDRSCTANINGLRGEAPHGAGFHTVDVTTDTWVPAGGTFVIADASDPALNHNLPGTVLAWAGQPADVLHNGGDTITLSINGTVIDSVTYPAFTLTAGTSKSFPANCPLDQRADWKEWQDSTLSWSPGFYGTPNAPNLDVSCQ
jgi:hypothetical protein